MKIRRIYAILGASGSGKTTAINYLCSKHGVEILTKWTTRDRRENDGPKIQSVTTIPDDCDIRYTSYGTDYGMKSSDIWKTIRAGKSGAVVLNDIRTLKLLNRQFSNFVQTVYIHSNISPQELFEEERKRFGTNFGEEQQLATQKRIEKIKAVHRKYIENASFFDTVILNVSSLSALYQQLDNNHLGDQRAGSEQTRAKCFIICGNSFSGKDELAVAMTRMQKDRVHSYVKASDRTELSDEEPKNLKHFAKGEIPKKYDTLYEMQESTYGISLQDIWKHLECGVSVVLVLNNFETIQKLVEKFEGLAVSVFLHANKTIGEARQILTEAGLSERKIELRLEVAQKLEEEFAEQPELFDHVLLNTTELEDLYDQAFNLFDAHCG